MHRRWQVADGHSDGDLLMIMMTMICIEQDANNKDTPMGQALIKEPDYQQWRAAQAKEALSCLAGKRAVPATSCAQILQRDPDTMPGGFSASYQQYAAGMKSMGPLEACAKRE